VGREKKQRERDFSFFIHHHHRCKPARQQTTIATHTKGSFFFLDALRKEKDIVIQGKESKTIQNREKKEISFIVNALLFYVYFL
jgi:hypothetical protein